MTTKAVPEDATADRRSALGEALTGTVITPADPAYDEARRVYSGTADLRPGLLVRAADTRDVQAVVRFAADTGAELAIRSGGHSAAGHGTSEGGVVLDLSALTAINIDPERRVATVGAGATAGEYVEAAGEHRLATGFGDTETVGVGGITVGGGMGLLSRRYGLTIDALLGAEVVTADGEILTVDAESHPDLFWAIRGGGGNFGVVTSFTFRLFDVDRVLGGLLVLPATPEVLAGFVDAAASAPDELTTIVTLLPCPPMPFVPAEAHGTTVLLTQLVWCGEPAEGERVLAPFRSLASPLADLIREQPYPALFAPEEAPRVTAITRTQFLDHVDTASAATMIDGINDCPAPMRILQLRILGGQIARVPADATAYGFRDRRIVTYQGGFYSGEDNRVATTAWADELVATLDQGRSGAYANFVGEPGQASARDCYPDQHWDRLVQIKNTYDPTNLFRRNHNIPPTGLPRAEA